MKAFGMRFLIQALTVFVPWTLRRILLQKLLGWELASDAKIGFSFLFCDHLQMQSRSKVGHFNFIRNTHRVQMGRGAVIGFGNFISGFSRSSCLKYEIDPQRAILSLEDGASITIAHIVETVAGVDLGVGAIIAGYRSTILGHTVDLRNGGFVFKPIRIGTRTFIGTGCTLLPGADICANAIVGAGSVVVGPLEREDCLYGGVPAREIKSSEATAWKTRNIFGFKE